MSLSNDTMFALLLIAPVFGFICGCLLDCFRDWDYTDTGRAYIATTPDKDPRKES